MNVLLDRGRSSARTSIDENGPDRDTEGRNAANVQYLIIYRRAYAGNLQ